MKIGELGGCSGPIPAIANSQSLSHWMCPRERALVVQISDEATVSRLPNLPSVPLCQGLDASLLLEIRKHTVNLGGRL